MWCPLAVSWPGGCKLRGYLPSQALEVFLGSWRYAACKRRKHLTQGHVQAWQLMFDSVDTANDCIRIATGVLSTIKINPKKMLAGLSPDMLATDLAEYLVRKGMTPLQTFSFDVSRKQVQELL